MKTKVTGAVRGDSGVVQVSMEAVKGGKEETLDCDVLLVCIGRRPYTDGLGLQVGVARVVWVWLGYERCWCATCRMLVSVLMIREGSM